MERFPNAIPDEFRSPAEALADLVDKFNRTARNDPQLLMLARMIRQLTEEIILRKRARILVRERASRRDAELGLC
jgi:hypothetical protein